MLLSLVIEPCKHHLSTGVMSQRCYCQVGSCVEVNSIWWTRSSLDVVWCDSFVPTHSATQTEWLGMGFWQFTPMGEPDPGLSEVGADYWSWSLDLELDSGLSGLGLMITGDLPKSWQEGFFAAHLWHVELISLMAERPRGRRDEVAASNLRAGCPSCGPTLSADWWKDPGEGRVGEGLEGSHNLVCCPANWCLSLLVVRIADSHFICCYYFFLLLLILRTIPDCAFFEKLAM